MEAFEKALDMIIGIETIYYVKDTSIISNIRQRGKKNELLTSQPGMTPIVLPPEITKDICENRIVKLICQLNINGNLLYVATIHATANQKVSDGEIKEICKTLIDICSGLTASWILMGDMNHEASHMRLVLKGILFDR